MLQGSLREEGQAVVALMVHSPIDERFAKE